jgi:hypothetical protein
MKGRKTGYLKLKKREILNNEAEKVGYVGFEPTTR